MNFVSRITAVLCSAAALVSTPSVAAYPERPVTFLVGVAAGGSVDTVARFLAKQLTEKWRINVIVENRPGASGAIAFDTLAHARPDGYTLGFVNDSFAVVPFQNKVTFDPYKDFAPVTRITAATQVFVVNPEVIKANTLSEFIALAKANPGKFNFGSGGQGTAPYLSMMLFMKSTSLDMVSISYDGVPASVIALLRGDIHALFGTEGTVTPQLKEGKIKALAVGENRRSANLPDLPTVSEAAGLPDFDEGIWYGLLAPAATPADIIKEIADGTRIVLENPDVQKTLAGQGFRTAPMPPAEFKAFVDGKLRKMQELLKSLPTQ